MTDLDRARALSRSDHPTLAVFSVLWALAAVWHLLGNTTVAPGWAQALLAGAVGVVLWRPGWPTGLALLSAAGLITVWLEAPLLGNHWLLAGFVNLALLLAMVTAALRRRWSDQADLANRLLPAARLSLLGFYAFAAFSKLNSGFFDTATSCGVFYFAESTDSLGLSALQLGGAGALEWAVIVGTVAVELSIPVLLFLRSTRRIGVVVGIGFHAVVALDRTHQFFDFSSVLTALFVLFLPLSAGTWVHERIGSIRARLALSHSASPGVAHAALVAVPTLAGLGVASGALDPRQALEVGWWGWQVFVFMVLLTVLRFLAQRPEPAERRALRPHHALFALVPLLVLVNGLTPYLEVKTGFGWNMYSNLRTVDGESNHFLVPGTLPLTEEQSDLVEIIRSDDPGLEVYAQNRYALTFNQLRAYLADHPDVGLVYRRGDTTVSLDRAADRPELVEPVPGWREKLQLFRAVDLHETERCVPTFGPAR